MKLRKVLSLCMGAALLASCTACGSKQAAAPAEKHQGSRNIRCKGIRIKGDNGCRRVRRGDSCR